MEFNGKGYTPIHDRQGSVVVLLDEQEKPVESYRYDAFGQESCTAKLNPWRFSSKRTDEETGFVYFGRRYYDPSLGKWMTKFDLHGLFIEDEDIGKADIAIVLALYGAMETIAIGLLDSACMLFVGSTDFDQDYHSNVALYNRLSSPIYEAANSLRSKVFTHAQNNAGVTSVDHYYDVGCAAVIVASSCQAINQAAKSVSCLRSNATSPSINQGYIEESIQSIERATQAVGKSKDKLPFYLPKSAETGSFLKLPRTPDGVNLPSSMDPYTQIGIRNGTHGIYRQTREWGYNGNDIKTTDWTDHRRFDHSISHDHIHTPNKTEGTFERNSPQDFRLTKQEIIRDTL